jgi:putative ABC transport system permease protein
MPPPHIFGSVASDVRYALRLLGRSPLFTTTSILSVAIGIAAATVIFGLADALLWRASPGIRDASRIVDIARTTNGRGFGTMSYPAFRHLREQTQSLEGMAATTLSPVPMSMRDVASNPSSESSERVYGRTVSANFFDVLRVRPALGRFFRGDEEDVADARPVVVLSHRFWRDRFRSDASVLDRTVSLNGVAFTVIGVAESGFENTTFVGSDLWIPMTMAAAVRAPAEPAAELFGDPRSTWHMAIGRLNPGVTVEAAQAELNTRFEAFKATVAPAVPATHGILVVRSGRVPPPVRLPFSAFVGLLFVLTAGLLAIACSNVAGMLLARSAARHREMATRLAIGASRGRLIGQMLIETLVLFGAAGLAALPIALWLTSALQSFMPALPMPVALDVSVNLRGLTFAGGVSLLAGLIFGLAPARQALRPDVSRMLHGQASTAGRDRLRLRQGLVVAQIALALAVTITAGLFARTLLAASRIDPGFRTANVDVITLDTSLAGATGADAVPLMERVVERIRTTGSVDAVGHARMIPLEGGSFAIGRVRVPGASDAALARLNDDNWDVVSPDYFRSVGLPLVAGRAFSRDDRAGRPLVAIVNESFARIAWPGRSAIGQRIWQVQGGARTKDGALNEGRPLDIIGVVKDAKYRTIGESARAFIYVPFAQQPQTRVELFVKHAAGRSIERDIRAAIGSIEPGLPIVRVQSFEEAAALGLFPQRLAAWTAACAGVIGIFLAALGLYGLAAFLVAQRTREIAIRMALGATRRDVRSMVLSQAARLGAAGSLAGVLLAVALGRRLTQNVNLLLGVTPTDPATLIAMSVLMLAVLFAATWIPARRATSTDPAAALRGE